jgi:hypothetical protein
MKAMLAALVILAFAVTAQAQIAICSTAKRLKETGRIKVNGGSAAVRTAEK